MTPGGQPALTLLVSEPSDPTPCEFVWPISKKVGEAADEAAAKFSLSASEPSFQNAAGEILDRNKTLVSEGVKSGDALDLVHAGGGVW